ncbi:unnamed protein product [Camellia sinensis]
MYMRPDGVIEQIPLERIEERDCRLVFASSIKQLPWTYTDDLLHTIDRLLLMVRRRQIALVTHGIELEPAPAVLAGPSAASRQRRGSVRSRGGADQGRGRVRQRSPYNESFDGSTTPEDKREEVDLQSSGPSEDSDRPPP